MKFAEMMFYAESEGLLPTKAGKINAVIRDIKDYPSRVIEQNVFEDILNDHDLSLNDLSSRELQYIEEAIR